MLNSDGKTDRRATPRSGLLVLMFTGLEEYPVLLLFGARGEHPTMNSITIIQSQYQEFRRQNVPYTGKLTFNRYYIC